jgi:uncharacterized protein YecE (DUF72 family)
MSATLNIGTSGWHYQHWRGSFYPAKLSSAEMLAWYAQQFSTVEINNTFYRLPTQDALLRWRQIAPPGFTFSVKASRFITHLKRLREPHDPIARFFSRVGLLGDRLGPILFQLPPNWPLNFERLEQFLPALPLKHRYAFEFRDPSCYAAETYDLLRRHNVALCLHDWRGMSWPIELTADFTYIRLHGPQGTYQGNYTPGMLRNLGKRILQWQYQLADIFVYFNNDQGGYAIKNAKSLEKFLLRKGSPRKAA